MVRLLLHPTLLLVQILLGFGASINELRFFIVKGFTYVYILKELPLLFIIKLVHLFKESGKVEFRDVWVATVFGFSGSSDFLYLLHVGSLKLVEVFTYLKLGYDVHFLLGLVRKNQNLVMIKIIHELLIGLELILTYFLPSGLFAEIQRYR